MTIKIISKNKIKISLTKSETDLLFGGNDNIDYSNRQSKLVLDMLLKEAYPDNSFLEDCEKLMIEVNSMSGGGSEIFFTKYYQSKKTRQSISKKLYLFKFKSCENMILAISYLYENHRTRNLKSSLYKMQNSYRLTILATPGFSDTAKHIEEFSDELSISIYEISYTEEYGKLISKDKAILSIGKAFSKSS